MTDHPLAHHLATHAAHFRQLTERLADPATVSGAGYADLLHQHARLASVVEPFMEWQRLGADYAAALTMRNDPELRAFAEDELHSIAQQREALMLGIESRLATGGNDLARPAVLEIRAGTGGDEAALFAGDLVRFYQQWLPRHDLRIEALSVSLGDKGGVKEAAYLVKGVGSDGLGAAGRLRFESGGHRVQRVPETEAQGRVHTSAATVAVLPEASEADVVIRPDELDIATTKASGAGGQHINKTESAIRITHKPSGLVVFCQEERSQGQNKEKAMRWLRSRLLQAEQERIAAQRADARRSQVGSGDRSDRIRTYNFPQNRITDHRVNFTGYSLDRYMDGDADELFAACVAHERAQFLATWDGSFA